MGFLIAAVVVVGVLAVANLLLSLRIAGRLNAYAVRLDRIDRAPRAEATMLGPGRTAGVFRAETVDGQTVSSEDLVDTTLVGFFAAGSPHCTERLAEFADYAEQHPGGWTRVLAVVIGSEQAIAEPMVARLIAVARVIQAPEDETVLRSAFGVRGYPAFGLVGDGGVIRASGDTVAALSVPPAAPANDDHPRGPRAHPEVRRA